MCFQFVDIDRMCAFLRWTYEILLGDQGVIYLIRTVAREAITTESVSNGLAGEGYHIFYSTFIVKANHTYVALIGQICCPRCSIIILLLSYLQQ